MKTVEKIASTVENAIESGLMELGINRDQAKIEVLAEEGRRGFLGLFGMKMARVRISHIEVKSEDLGKMACQLLQEMVDAMDVQASFDVVNKDDDVTVNISGDNLGMLIGRRGDTLEAIQFWTNLALSKKLAERKRVTVDIEGYRKRREETLTRLAYKLADKAKKTGGRVALEPMNPQERRTIHMALQNDFTISTYSEGQEPNRRVVILPKRGRDRDSLGSNNSNSEDL